jgi:hypothetical protein
MAPGDADDGGGLFRAPWQHDGLGQAALYGGIVLVYDEVFWGVQHPTLAYGSLEFPD